MEEISIDYSFKYLLKTTNIRALKFETWDHSNFAYTEDIDAAIAANKLGGGIYKMFNQDAEVIYVGKSNNLQRRLLEHIGKRSNTSYFIDEVKKIQYHVNNDPTMQTMLEGIFIAYLQPKYNDEVKDKNKNDN